MKSSIAIEQLSFKPKLNENTGISETRKSGCRYSSFLLVAGSCTPTIIPVQPTFTGRRATLRATVTFTRLQLRDGQSNQAYKLGLFTSAQLLSAATTVAMSTSGVAERVRLTPPIPILSLEALTTLKSNADQVVMTTNPPASVTAGKAFTVVCRVTSNGAPLATQRVFLNVSSSSSTIMSASAYFQNMFAPAGEPPAVVASAPRLVDSSARTVTGVCAFQYAAFDRSEFRSVRSSMIYIHD